MNVLSKVKNSKLAKVIGCSVIASAVAVMGCISAFATDGTSVSDQLKTAFQSVQSDISSYIIVVLPIALGIFGLYFGIKKAISFFRSSAK